MSLITKIMTQSALTLNSIELKFGLVIHPIIIFNLIHLIKFHKLEIKITINYVILDNSFLFMR